MSNRTAFLAMIAHSEIGETLMNMPETDKGYKVLVGCTPSHLLLFNDYSHHPHVINHALDSSAAGRYQIIYPTYFNLCNMKGYTDFTPETQDAMAIDLIHGRGALEDVDMGRFADAVFKCREEWASLPGGDSGQHENKLADLQDVYTDFGGTLA